MANPKIEMIRAFPDGHWDIVTLTVPDRLYEAWDLGNDAALNYWAERKLRKASKVDFVHVGIHNTFSEKLQDLCAGEFEDEDED